MGLGALGGTELLRPLDKHAEEVSRSHQLHRAKGSREELPCRVKGQRPLGSLVSTRGNSMKMRSTESRERESRGSKTLWQGQGAAPLAPPPKNEEGSRELLLSTRFCGVSLRWLRRCTPAKCRAWIPPFQRGWSPARTRPRCTGCRGRSRSPCRNTRRTDAPAHASW